MELRLNNNRIIWLLKNSTQFGKFVLTEDEYYYNNDPDDYYPCNKKLLPPAQVSQETMDAWSELEYRLDKTGYDGIQLWQQCLYEDHKYNSQYSIEAQFALAYITGRRKKQPYIDYKKHKKWQRGPEPKEYIDKEEYISHLNNLTPEYLRSIDEMIKENNEPMNNKRKWVDKLRKDTIT